jgi:hypothetical protein
MLRPTAATPILLQQQQPIQRTTLHNTNNNTNNNNRKTLCLLISYVLGTFALMIIAGGRAAHNLSDSNTNSFNIKNGLFNRPHYVFTASSPNNNNNNNPIPKTSSNLRTEEKPTDQLQQLQPIPLSTTTSTSTIDPFQTLDHCKEIKQLLTQPNLPSPESQGLPDSGKEQGGITFWIKKPILKIDNPPSLLLKYNKYLPTQHTIKWTNTVSVLGKYSHLSSILPRLFGHCRDPGDTFHYVLVEWIHSRPKELIKPTTFQQCFNRAIKLMEALTVLDDELHLGLFDVKPGQWMARINTNNNFDIVFQDADDIAPSPWKSIKDARYPDQIDRAIRRIQWANPNKIKSFLEAHRTWHVDLFPDHTYTIRYTMILLYEILEHDMGFSWRDRECSSGQPKHWRSCLESVLEWTATVEDDWPAPKQVLDALLECGSSNNNNSNGKFTKTIRPQASWRDLDKTEILANTREPYFPPSSCVRPYDRSDAKNNNNNNDGNQYNWCGEGDTRSCCRNKGLERCYYTVSDLSLCV